MIENNKKEKLIYETISNIGIKVNDLPVQYEIVELPPGIRGFGNSIDIPGDFRAYVSYPVYEQNYLIADIISWQVHEYIEKEYGKNYSMNPEVGEYLKEKLWKTGELKDWQVRIKLATGKELDVEGYLKYLLE